MVALAPAMMGILEMGRMAIVLVSASLIMHLTLLYAPHTSLGISTLSTSTPSTLLYSGCCMSLSAHAAPSSIGLPSFAFVAHHQPPQYISSPHAHGTLVLLTVLLV